MEAFTLKKHKEIGEYHIFKGDFTSTPCTSEVNSICGDMPKSKSESNIFQCKKEDEARALCAKEGRKVCANCIQYLYTTLKNKK